jgi:chorismate-pyruvate lyase
MAHCNEFGGSTAAAARLNKKMGLCEISQRPIGKIMQSKWRESRRS